MTRSKTLAERIGASLRILRSQAGDVDGYGAGLSQEEVARVAREHGLPWRRATVAAVEAGQRSVTIEELVILSLAFERPLHWWVPDDGGTVRLSSTVEGPALGVTSLLAGRSGSDPDMTSARRLALGLDLARWKIEPAERSRRGSDDDYAGVVAAVWPKASGAAIRAARMASVREAEVKAGRALGVSPLEVALRSIRRWGQSLTEERDARVAVLGNASARTLQARRGHVTRALLNELRDDIARATGGPR